MQDILWLIGAGPMAVDYAKVLMALEVPFLTIGRGTNSASIFKEKTGRDVFTGGLQEYLKTKPELPGKVIVATGVEALAETCSRLVESGMENILCEKPGGLNSSQINHVAITAKKYGAKILLAYNRRFYSSVSKAREIIEEDGGLASMNFEFTEWGHVIAPLIKAEGVKENWFLANSTHVADLAFFLAGKPVEINCHVSGGVPWHPSASVFAGSGITQKGVLFSYQANWEAPGRWAIELLTKDHRLYLKPMEKLQIQNKGSVQVDFVPLEDEIDTKFKPGLFRQTKAYLENNMDDFMTIEEQAEMMPFYNKIAGYIS